VLFYKIASVYYIQKYINILALEMASPGNRHSANCIGALSFPRRMSKVLSRRNLSRRCRLTFVRTRFSPSVSSTVNHRSSSACCSFYTCVILNFIRITHACDSLSATFAAFQNLFPDDFGTKNSRKKDFGHVLHTYIYTYIQIYIALKIVRKNMGR